MTDFQSTKFDKVDDLAAKLFNDICMANNNQSQDKEDEEEDNILGKFSQKPCFTTNNKKFLDFEIKQNYQDEANSNKDETSFMEDI